MQKAAPIALALFLLLWSGATFLVDVLFAAPYREIAGQLETGRATAPDATYHARVESSLGGSPVLSLCVRDIVRSSVSIALATLEAAYRQKAPPAELDAALAAAKETLERAISCQPNDGNYRLRLAMVDYAAKRGIADVEAGVLASQALAPSEAWIAMPRLAFAAQLPAPVDPAIAQLVQSDAHNLVWYVRPLELADFYLATGGAARRALDDALAGAQENRQTELRQVFEWKARSNASSN